MSDRIKNMASRLRDAKLDAMLVATPVSLLYLTGRIFDGWLIVNAEGDSLCFQRRPVPEDALSLRHPGQIPALIKEKWGAVPALTALETGILAAEYLQLSEILPVTPAPPILRELRMVKDEDELASLQAAAVRQDACMVELPGLFRPGMRDIEFAAGFEASLRRHGHLGIMRTDGIRFESCPSSVLVGDNASVPSPYDYSLGGQGFHASFPFGPRGEILSAGKTVMADAGFCYEGYITDCSRTYAVGSLSQRVLDAHKAAMEILDTLENQGKPGTPCSALYEKALSIAAHHGLSDNLMGITQQARFVGHGVGLVLNEAPVIAPKDHTPLACGMALALEPKFAFPGIGAVGLENTYVVTPGGLRCLHRCQRELVFVG